MEINLNHLKIELKEKVCGEEKAFQRKVENAESLWGHLERVAFLSQKIGQIEGVDDTTAYVAGLFHDAGKFLGGTYHEGDVAEEELSVQVLNRLGKKFDLDEKIIETAEESILQLYRDDPEPLLLTKVIFDADNLDKLGPLGVANYFIKRGLRGRGMSRSLLFRLTVELTYARHAPHVLQTAAGRALASRRAVQTRQFLETLCDTLRDDGLYDFRREEITFENLVFDIVEPLTCVCGAKIKRKIWKVPGMKCSEIHLEHTCYNKDCQWHNKIRFCCPKLHRSPISDL